MFNPNQWAKVSVACPQGIKAFWCMMYPKFTTRLIVVDNGECTQRSNNLWQGILIYVIGFKPLSMPLFHNCILLLSWVWATDGIWIKLQDNGFWTCGTINMMLVTVEHFSKWIELMLLSKKSNERVVYAFLNRVLKQFGPLVKVFMDQSKMF